MDPIKAPFLTYDDVNSRAGALLKQYGQGDCVPVDIEAIVELDMGITVIPVRGLQERFGVDGFLSLKMAEITVDEAIFRGHPSRYRFTVAHELGHMVLHREVFESVDVRTPKDWVDFYHAIPDDDYGWLERQAYWFAGAVLVPEDACIAEYHTALEKAKAATVDVNLLSVRSRSHIAGAVARRFQVSTGVIERRLAEIGLW